MADERRDTEPHTRLTRIGERLIRRFEADGEFLDGDKLIIMIDDGEEGGISFVGYEHDEEAVADLFMHLQAIFRANGSDLQVHRIGRG